MGSPKPPPELSQIGEYQVKGLVGEGGMGLVYEGVQPKIGKRVAIKLLKEEVKKEAARLLEEARVVNQIGHRGIIDIFSFGELADGRQYFVMEFLNGVALSSHVAHDGPLNVEDTLQISEEICSALAAAHDVGVIHRDLKPSNIFLVSSPDGSAYVKLLDFGLAKQAELAGGDTPQTVSSRILGTPRYMAPEQVTGEPIGPRTDLYALGIIIFEMLTKTVPFTAKTLVETLTKQLNNVPPPPSSVVEGVPELFDGLVLKLLEKDPAYRPPSAQVVLDEVRRIRDVLGLRQRPLKAAAAGPERKARPRAPGSSVSGSFDWTPSSKNLNNPLVAQATGGDVTRASRPRVTAETRAEIPASATPTRQEHVVLDAGVDVDPARAGATVVGPAPPAPPEDSTRLFTQQEIAASSTARPPESTAPTPPSPAAQKPRRRVATAVVFVLAAMATTVFVLLLVNDGKRDVSPVAVVAPKPAAPQAAAPKTQALEVDAPTPVAPGPELPKAAPPQGVVAPPDAPKAAAPKADTPKSETPKSETPKSVRKGGNQLKRLERVESAWVKARSTRRPEDVRLFDTSLEGIRRQSKQLSDRELRELLDDFVANALAGAEP